MVVILSAITSRLDYLAPFIFSITQNSSAQFKSFSENLAQLWLETPRVSEDNHCVIP
jgi:hypothetical protein